MVKFEDAINNQPFGQSKEDYAWQRFVQQNARHQEQQAYPVNVRYRELLGKMATTLTEHGIPLEPYTLGIGVRYGMDYADNMRWFTNDSTHTHGWGLSIKPRFTGGRPPQMHGGGTTPGIGSSDNQAYYNYLFLKHDGLAASRTPGAHIVPVEKADEAHIARGNLLIHNNILHVAIDDVLTDRLVHYNEDTPGGYRLHEGEIVYYGKDYQFSFEENLAALLASKLAQ